ncbi:MAG: DEAD/DEAH box helicase [Planctomycetaceae bacterium]|nr:DEAD/DEAH box helicase [Planctomycetaceae bacterium]
MSVVENFPTIRFQGTLRPSQADVVEIAKKQLQDGERRLHIVAPPGSGKTVLGLYLWAECIRQPAVVFSPTSAIQMQWAARTDLFQMEDGSAVDRHTSTDPTRPDLLTSLTYQSVTLPRRADEETDRVGREKWIADLIKKEEAGNFDEANAWIDDIQRNNPAYYNDRLGVYRKKARDARAKGGDSLETLHRSSLAALGRLKNQGVGLVIFDECHHLMDHWGRVLADADEFLGSPIIVGLTATPPDVEEKETADVRRYRDFFGPVDYEVPVPAVVKDGFLAPYQDLVYFVYPTVEELRWLDDIGGSLNELVWQLSEPVPAPPPIPGSDPLPLPVPSLPEWIRTSLHERRLGTITCSNWEEFESRFRVYSYQSRKLLQHMGRELPANVPDEILLGKEDRKRIGELPVGSGNVQFELLVPVLERYIRHGLRRSAAPGDHQRAEHATGVLRSFGVQVTMDRTQACASPVARVVAYSRGKCDALVPILSKELEVLGERIRAVVITDYEKTSAVTPEISHLLDEEAGGAVAAFKQILSDPITDQLDPILVTGSTVLVDDDLCERFLAAAQAWLAQEAVEVKLEAQSQGVFMLIKGRGSAWGTRVFVQLVTHLFQQGLTRCLVGTRGLLGEGWDASRTNTLIDLTTATTTMTVNQLRGRSIRLDSKWPEKLADNWDIVCLGSGPKGNGDFARFLMKHNATYGVCEDGAIEKGPGHVHPAVDPRSDSYDKFVRDFRASIGVMNSEMLARAERRGEARKLWRIGEPFQPLPTEVTLLKFHAKEKKIAGFPPFGSKGREPQTMGEVVEKMGRAIVLSLAELKVVPVPGNAVVTATERQSGYFRILLRDKDPNVARVFNEALREMLAPIDEARYVIPRYMDEERPTLLSRILPGVLGKYFVRYDRQLAMWHAVPKVFARNKTKVAVFEKHWNRHVSPGEAVFSQRGDGADLVKQATAAGLAPACLSERREVFLTQ